jgi:hypothetical protein
MRPDISRADWERFSRSAAPQSIEHYVGEAQRERRRWDGLVGRLEDLLRERLGQVERGEWPPPPQGQVPVIPAGQIGAEVAADVHRLTHPAGEG